MNWPEALVEICKYFSYTIAVVGAMWAWAWMITKR